MNPEISIRPVVHTDLPILYSHQRDPVSVQMAAFPSRDESAFMAHWHKLMLDQTVILRTILYQGQVAGTVMSFIQREQRQVGYWIDRLFWGRGIATRALELFLEDLTERPLYARVAVHNIASRRVLEKCGFSVIGEELGPDIPGMEGIRDYILELKADEAA